MAQEFKFGDRIMLPGGEEAVVLSCDGITLAVAYPNCGMDYLRLADVADVMVLLRHPDTMRPEKIGRLAVEAMGMAFDLDEYRRQIDQIGEQV